MPKDTPTKKETAKDRIGEYFDNRPLRTDPFFGNIIAEDGYKRAERISAAIHLMTSHIENSEPLKYSLRSESILLLDCALLIQGELRAAASEHVRKMQGSIRKLISLVSLAGVAGRVSGSNAHLLVDALDDLGGFLLGAQRSAIADSVLLQKEDLVPRLEPKNISSTQRMFGKKTEVSAKDVTVKDKIKDGAVKPHNASRSQRILAVLAGRDALAIKDVLSVLPEYSEKMIQRDLAALVNVGSVVKIGEKRWSRYSLAK